MKNLSEENNKALMNNVVNAKNKLSTAQSLLKTTLTTSQDIECFKGDFQFMCAIEEASIRLDSILSELDIAIEVLWANKKEEE